MYEATRTVTPEGLRAAARILVVEDGQEGGPAACRYAGWEWERRLLKTYKANRPALRKLAGYIHPLPMQAEIELLELCKQDMNRLGMHRHDRLIDMAITGPEMIRASSSPFVIRGIVKQYPFRTAYATDIYLRLPRGLVEDLEQQLAEAASATRDNHTVYEIVQFSGITYVQFSGQEAIFGRAIREKHW